MSFQEWWAENCTVSSKPHEIASAAWIAAQEVEQARCLAIAKRFADAAAALHDTNGCTLGDHISTEIMGRAS